MPSSAPAFGAAERVGAPVRHSTATACEDSEARIRALEEELEAAKDYAEDALINKQAALEALDRANEQLVQMTAYAAKLKAELERRG